MRLLLLIPLCVLGGCRALDNHYVTAAGPNNNYEKQGCTLVNDQWLYWCPYPEIP